MKRFVAESVTYHYSSDDENVIDFLTGVLNSKTINKIIKPFQSAGLAGPRDIHKLPLKIDIPLYNVNISIHVTIANKANEISSKASNLEIPDSINALGKRRQYIRDQMERDFQELDELVISMMQLTQKLNS